MTSTLLASAASMVSLPLLVLLLAAFACAPASGASSPQRLIWDKLVPADGVAPPARTRMALEFDWKRNQIVMFGGAGDDGVYDDTWVFDLSTRKWRQLSFADGVRPERRFSLVSGMDPDRDRFVISTGQGDGRVFYNDVWALNLTSVTWSRLRNSGQPPETRYGGAGGTHFVSPRFLIVSHGFADKRYDNAFAYDLVAETWSDITPSDPPTARCLHSGAVVNGNFVMFGGCGSGGHGPCPAQDTHRLAFDPVAPSAATARWIRMDTCPAPRTYSSLTISPTTSVNTSTIDRLVLFGGNGYLYGSGSKGDVGVLDVATGSWELLHVAPAVSGGDLPSVRQGSGFTFVRAKRDQISDGDYAVMWGGTGGDTTLWTLKLAPAASSPPSTTFSCPFIFDLRLFHGLMMFFSWGLFLPIGVAVARFGKGWKDALWFRIHRPLQVFGVVLMIGGFIAALLMVNVGHFTARPHSIIGVIVVALGIIQPLNAVIRPHPAPRTTWRVVWEYWHKYFGRVAVLLGMINIFQGLTYARSPDAVKGLYAAWFAIYWLFWIVQTVRGQPASSPVARAVSSALRCNRGNETSASADSPQTVGLEKMPDSS